MNPQDILARAQMARTMGQADDALDLYDRAAALARETGDAAALAHALRHVCDLCRELGMPGAALSAGREAVGLYKTLPGAKALDLANALRVTALAQEAAGFDARDLWREAGGLYSHEGVIPGALECEARALGGSPS